MKFNRKLLIILILPAFITVSAQDKQLKEYTLKAAQDYALQNAYAVQNAKTDILIAKKKVQETTAIGLPQVNGSLEFADFMNIPTQLIPDFLTPAIEGVLLQQGLIDESQLTSGSGQMFPVQFGAKYSLTAGATATQLLFDGSYIVGLQAAKTFVEFSENAHKKSQSEIKEAVAQAYYLVLVAEENRKILASTLENTRKTQEEVTELEKNGLIENTDVDQMQLVVSGLENKLSMVDRQVGLTYDLLKFQMGLDIKENIKLTDPLNAILSQAISENLAEKKFDFNNHIDFKMLRTQERLNYLSLKRNRYAYLPSLAAFFTYQVNGIGNEFDYLKKSQDWYKTTLLGFNLSVPIWSSGMRKYKVQQDILTLDKTKVMMQQAQQGLELEVSNQRANLRTYSEQLINDESNLDLAKRIYDKTLIKYQEGLSTSMELTQAQNQYLTAQGSYFATLFELLKSRSSLNKAMDNN